MVTMANPFPTGTGQVVGLDQRQDAGTPLPSRSDRSKANDSANAVPCDKTPGHADGQVHSFDPYQKVKS